MEELSHSFIYLKTKIHLRAVFCASKSTHPNILNASSVVAFLCIMCAALFCRRRMYAIDNPPHTVSV